MLCCMVMVWCSAVVVHKNQLSQMLVFASVRSVEKVVDELPAHLLLENTHVDFVVVTAGQQGGEQYPLQVQL